MLAVPLPSASFLPGPSLGAPVLAVICVFFVHPYVLFRVGLPWSGTCQFSMLLAPVRRALVWPVFSPTCRGSDGGFVGRFGRGSQCTCWRSAIPIALSFAELRGSCARKEVLGSAVAGATKHCRLLISQPLCQCLLQTRVEGVLVTL